MAFKGHRTSKHSVGRKEHINVYIELTKFLMHPFDKSGTTAWTGDGDECSRNAEPISYRTINQLFPKDVREKKNLTSPKL